MAHKTTRLGQPIEGVIRYEYTGGIADGGAFYLPAAVGVVPLSGRDPVTGRFVTTVYMPKHVFWEQRTVEMWPVATIDVLHARRKRHHANVEQ